MDYYYNIGNTTFFYKNIFKDETFLEDVIKECQYSILDEKFFARFGVESTFNKQRININKSYSQYTELEKYIFKNSKNLKNSFITIRKDVEILISETTRKILDEKITNIVNVLYPEKAGDIKIEYSSIIGDNDGYMMNKHTDSGNNRLCTAVFYLNSKENNSGGDVIFYEGYDKNAKEMFRYSPQKNDLIIFDSFRNESTLEHSVDEIKNWDRYVYRIYFK